MSDSVADTLTALLVNEQSTVDRLLTELDHESKALSAHDIKKIEHAAIKKKQLLDTFAHQVTARMQYISTQGFAASEAGFDTLLMSLPTSQYAPLMEQWQTLKLAFAGVQSLNERNGIVIHHSQQRTKALLNILHGNKNEPNLYNQTGSANQQKQRHTLGEA